MQRFGKFVGEFIANESGISSVEYALLLAFVAGGIIVGAGLLSDAVQTEMKETAECIDGSVAC